MMDVADDLPETTPQFIVLSHPLTLVSGPPQPHLTPPYIVLMQYSAYLEGRSSLCPLCPPLLQARELQNRHYVSVR
jgi:hypothetical protein